MILPPPFQFLDPGPMIDRELELIAPEQKYIDDMLAAGSEADLVEALSLPVPSAVIAELLCVPYADHEFFQEHSSEFVRADATPEERGAAVGHLKSYIGTLVDGKIKTPGDDLLSRRLTAGADPEEVASRSWSHSENPPGWCC